MDRAITMLLAIIFANLFVQFLIKAIGKNIRGEKYEKEGMLAAMMFGLTVAMMLGYVAILMGKMALFGTA